MNHALWKATGARVLAMTFIIAGAAACDRGGDDDRNTRVDKTGLPTAASPSAQVIGTPPAAPTPGPDSAQTAPTSAAAKSDVPKTAESTARPIEGDNHSYSTLAPTTPQKADGVNRTGDGGQNQRSPQ
jgi:hypothetical protein